MTPETFTDGRDVSADAVIDVMTCLLRAWAELCWKKETKAGIARFERLASRVFEEITGRPPTPDELARIGQ